MFQTGVYICIKLAGNVPVVFLIMSQGLCSTILGLIVLIFWEKSFHFFTFPDIIWQEFVCIFCICSVGYVSQWTLTRGGQLLIAGLASLMRATDIAWSFVYGAIFFKEYPNYLTLIGAVTMFSSVLMVSIEKVKNAGIKKIEQQISRQEEESRIIMSINNENSISVLNQNNNNNENDNNKNVFGIREDNKFGALDQEEEDYGDSDSQSV